MSFAELGRTVTLLASTGSANGAPSGSVGIVVSDSFPGVMRTSKYLIKVKVTGAGAISIAAFLWGRQRSSGDWGQLGDKLGQLNDGNAIAGSVARVYQAPLEFLSAFERLYLEVSGLSGTPTFEATLTEILE